MAKKPAEKAETKATPDPDPFRPRKAPMAEPDPHGDIDQRMAALLKDHQRMGSRPK